jgi:hypothetical protein
MRQWCEKEGGDLRFKSGLKIVVMGGIFYFRIRSSFHEESGGIGGPNSPYGAMGSPQKNSHNLLVYLIKL